MDRYVLHHINKNPETKITEIVDESNSESDENIDILIEHRKYKRKIYQQKFRSTWVEKFPWVEKTKSDESYCKICGVIVKGGAFHLNRHEKSISHRKKQQSVVNTHKVTNVFNNDQSLLKQTRNAEIKLAAFLCERNLPFTVMDILPDLCKSIFPDSMIAKNLNMKRNKATQIVNSLGYKIKTEIINELKFNRFSLIIDETTDVSVKKSLVMVVRYWKENEATDVFLSLSEIKDSTAQSIFEFIKNFLDSNEIPYTNLMGFGADNANVMMGNIGGVQTLLKRISPNIVVQGCSCHSLHLISSAAAKKLPNNVEQFVRDIYAYFSHSSKRREELQECQIFINEKPHKMLAPSQTRWLSLIAVVKRILEHWNSLQLFFQRAALEENLPAAKSILNALTNPIYKLYLLFLSSSLQIMTDANKEFQSETPKVPVLLNKVKGILRMFLKYYVKQEVLRDLDDVTNIDAANPRNFKDIDHIYFGANVEIVLNNPDEVTKIDKHDLRNFKLKCLEFYIEIIKQLKSRFNFNDKILNYASNFTPEVALSGEKLSLADGFYLFPDASLEPEKINIEWQRLSEIDNFRKYSSNISEFWKNVSICKDDLGQPIFDNLMKLVKIILILPHSSATAERMFSQLSLIKTSCRNLLLIETVDAILHVQQSVKRAGNSITWTPI